MHAKLIAPNGQEIQGTLDDIRYCRADVMGVEYQGRTMPKVEHGDDVVFDYEGYTKVNWEGQETRTTIDMWIEDFTAELLKRMNGAGPVDGIWFEVYKAEHPLPANPHTMMVLDEDWNAWPVTECTVADAQEDEDDEEAE